MGIWRFFGHRITGNCYTTLIHQPNSRSLVAYLVPRAARMGDCGQVTTCKSALFVSQTVLHLSNHLIFRWFDSENVCAVYSSCSTLLQGQHSPITVLYSVPFKEIWSTIISFFFIITVLIDKMDLHSVWFPISTNSDLKARIAPQKRVYSIKVCYSTYHNILRLPPNRSSIIDCTIPHSPTDKPVQVITNER